MIDHAVIPIDCIFAELHESEMIRIYACKSPKAPDSHRMVSDRKCADCKYRVPKEQIMQEAPNGAEPKQMRFGDEVFGMYGAGVRF